MGQDPSLAFTFPVCKVRDVNKISWGPRAGMRVRVGGAKLILFSLRDPQPCCNWDPNKGEYVFPAKKKLQEYRVLITTLVTASRWECVVCLLITCGSKGAAGRGGASLDEHSGLLVRFLGMTAAWPDTSQVGLGPVSH